jgi:ABC-type amino acid transport substrate-binding protein
MAKWNRLIPYVKDQIVEYAGTSTRGFSNPNPDIVWRPLFEFEASMTFSSIQKGRSSVTVYFTDTKGKTHPFFLSEFQRAIPFMSRGKIKGKFTQAKRGSNFGTCVVDLEQLP